ncbi:MAG: hypothetical protein EOP07_21220, partial [Proteobacteria bacterium]
MNQKVSLYLVLFTLNTMACRTIENSSQQKAEVKGASSESPLVSSSKGSLLKNFYAENKVIDVEIKTKDWDTIRYADPKGGLCNFSYAGPQYDWYEAEEVKIDGKTFAKVGIKKKSWCGSESKFKPSL